MRYTELSSKRRVKWTSIELWLLPRSNDHLRLLEEALLSEDKPGLPEPDNW